MRFRDRLQILALTLFLQSCVTAGGGSEALVGLVTFPLHVVGLAVAALIGAAAGMGTGAF